MKKVNKMFKKSSFVSSSELELHKRNTLKLLIDSKAFQDSNPYLKEGPSYNTDSGFDLYFPKSVTVPPGLSFGIKLGVRGSMTDYDGDKVGYQLVPRSSISKTPLRLANCIGIIDQSYRGQLIVVVDNFSLEDYHIEKHQRLFQLVSHNGFPIDCDIVSELDKTERGEYGFGSTGK